MNNKELENYAAKATIRRVVNLALDKLLDEFTPNKFDNGPDDEHRHAIGATSKNDLPGGLLLVLNIGILDVKGMSKCVMDAVHGSEEKDTTAAPDAEADVIWPDELTEVQG